MEKRTRMFIPKQALRNRIAELEDAINRADRKNDLLRGSHDILKECFERLFPVAFNDESLICGGGAWGARANPSEDHEKHREYFKFIPMNPDEITQSVVQVNDMINKDITKAHRLPYDGARPKFLDVGCGLGNVMLLAFKYFEVYGVEFSERYVQAARKMLSAASGRNDISDHVIHCDALNYNEYGKYDVIYWYRPISDGKLMRDLATRVVKQMKIGTYLIPLSHYSMWADDFTEKEACDRKVINIDEHPGFERRTTQYSYSRILKKIAEV